jgi:hypothetical protein
MIEAAEEALSDLAEREHGSNSYYSNAGSSNDVGDVAG